MNILYTIKTIAYWALSITFILIVLFYSINFLYNINKWLSVKEQNENPHELYFKILSRESSSKVKQKAKNSPKIEPHTNTSRAFNRPPVKTKKKVHKLILN